MPLVIDSMLPLWDQRTYCERTSSAARRFDSFCQAHAHAGKLMDHWYRVAKRAIWASFTEVKQTFNTADFMAPYVVFDIGGNKYRLIAKINFSRKVLFIHQITTH